MQEMQFQTFDLINTVTSPESGRSEKATAFGHGAGEKTSSVIGAKSMSLDKLSSKSSGQLAAQSDTFESYLSAQSRQPQARQPQESEAQDKGLVTRKDDVEEVSTFDASVSGDENAANKVNGVLPSREVAVTKPLVMTPGVGVSQNRFATQTAIQQGLVASNGPAKAETLLSDDGGADVSLAQAEPSQGETAEETVSSETSQIVAEAFVNTGVVLETSPLKTWQREGTGFTTASAAKADSVPDEVHVAQPEPKTGKKTASVSGRFPEMTRDSDAEGGDGFAGEATDSSGALTAERSVAEAAGAEKDKMQKDQWLVTSQEQVMIMGSQTATSTALSQGVESDATQEVRSDLYSKMQNVEASLLSAAVPRSDLTGEAATARTSETVDHTGRKATDDMLQPNAKTSFASVASTDTMSTPFVATKAMAERLTEDARAVSQAVQIVSGNHSGNHSDAKIPEQTPISSVQTADVSALNEGKVIPGLQATEGQDVAFPEVAEEIVAPKVTRETVETSANSSAQTAQNFALSGMLTSAEVQTSSVTDTDQISSLGDLGPIAHMSPETAALREQTAATSATNRIELPTHIASQIADVARQLPDRPVEITLSPEELGKVRLSFHLSENGAMQVVIAAERADTLDLLRRNVESLITEFRDLGYADSGFTFQNFDQGTQQGGSDAFSPPIGSSATSDMTDSMPSETPVRLSLGSASGMDLRL
jgi:hypothetical protein